MTWKFRRLVLPAALIGAGGGLVHLALPGQHMPSGPPSQPDYFKPGEILETDFELGSAGEGEAFRSAVAGHFTPDFHGDVAVLRGGEPWLHYGSAIYHATLHIPQQATAMACYPEYGPNGIDSLMIVHDQGADLWTFAEATGSFTAEPIGNAAWAGASDLCIRDLDLNGFEDLVALSSDGQTLIVEMNLDPATRLGLELDPPIEAIAALVDLCVADWTGNGELEILVLSSLGLEVFDRVGTRLTYLPFAVVEGFMAPFRQSGYSRDRLVLCATHNQNGDFMMYTSDDTRLEQVTPVGPLDLRGVAVGNVDGNLRDDVLFYFGAGLDCALMLNESNQQNTQVQTFVMSNVIYVSTGQNEFATAAVLADLDHDDDDDLVSFYPTLGRAVFHRNLNYSGTLAKINVGPDSEFDIEDPNLPVLNMHLTAPTNRLAGATEVETLLWRQQLLGGPLDPVASRHDFHPCDVTFPALVSMEVDVVLPVITDVVYYVEMREVRRVDDGTGHLIVADAGPFRLHALSIYGGTTQQFQEDYGTTIVVPVVNSPSGGIPDSTTGPGLTPWDCIPETEDNGPPDPNGPASSF
jgi:hypothetical protein